jgi:hypothetical protein
MTHLHFLVFQIRCMQGSEGVGKGCTTTFFVKLGIYNWWTQFTSPKNCASCEVKPRIALPRCINDEWKLCSSSTLLPVKHIISICEGKPCPIWGWQRAQFCDQDLWRDFWWWWCMDMYWSSQNQLLLHYCSCGYDQAKSKSQGRLLNMNWPPVLAVDCSGGTELKKENTLCRCSNAGRHFTSFFFCELKALYICPWVWST